MSQHTKSGPKPCQHFNGVNSVIVKFFHVPWVSTCWVAITLTPECIQSTSVTPPPFPIDISHAEFEVSYQLLGFDLLLPEGVLMLDTLFQLYLHQPQCVSVARWPSLHWLFEK